MRIRTYPQHDKTVLNETALNGTKLVQKLFPESALVPLEVGTLLSDEELKYPKWQSDFQEAVIELDGEKLFGKIQQFETAVFVRLQDLASDSDHHVERKAIADALSTIRVLKKDKLSHPDWNQNR